SMSDEPPPRYVAYPRPKLGGKQPKIPAEDPKQSTVLKRSNYGSLQQLRALVDGYNGLNRIFATYLGLQIALRVAVYIFGIGGQLPV
ncbi:hypothetical protein ABTM42_20550, partial [Acinetobacter baumannii]